MGRARVRAARSAVLAVLVLSFIAAFFAPTAAAAADPKAGDTPKALAVIPDLRPIYRVRTKDPVVFITIDDGVFKSGLPADLMAVTIMGIPHSFLMVWMEMEGADLMSLVPSAQLAVDRLLGAAG